jgi:hypothetical protein
VARLALLEAGGVLDGRDLALREILDRPADDIERFTEEALYDPLPSFLLGPDYSTAAAEVLDLVERQKIPALADAGLGELDGYWPACRPWMFTQSAPLELSGVLTGLYLADEGCDHVTAALYDSETGQGYVDGLTVALTARGVPYTLVPLSRDVPDDLSDYDPLLAEFQTGRCGFLHASARVGETFLTQWHAAPRPPGFVWVTSFSEASVLAFDDPSTIEGTFTFQVPTGVQMRERAALVDDYLQLEQEHLGAAVTDELGHPKSLATRSFDRVVQAALSVHVAGTRHDGRATRQGFWRLSEGTDTFGPGELEALLVRDSVRESTHYSGPYSSMRFTETGRTTEWSTAIYRALEPLGDPVWSADLDEISSLLDTFGYGPPTPSSCTP